LKDVADSVFLTVLRAHDSVWADKTVDLRTRMMACDKLWRVVIYDTYKLWEAAAEQPNRGVVMDDELSKVHYSAVWAEIQGRFFSKEEADRLKESIDHHTVTDPQTRAAAAKAWEG
jgi:hypothetical protein